MCESFIWKRDNPGAVERTASGESLERKDPNIPLRCLSCPKVPKWAKDAGKDWRELRALATPDMTSENAEALRHYRECRAVGIFPDDPIVRWYAGIIREVENEADRLPLERQTAATLQLMTLLTLKLRGRW